MVILSFTVVNPRPGYMQLKFISVHSVWVIDWIYIF